jgi:hypothetical protein
MQKLNSFVYGEKHKPRFDPLLSHLTGRFDPSEDRHRDVQQNDVRLKQPRRRDEISAVIDAPNDLKVRFQQSLHSFDHGTMVVGQ